MLYWIVFQFFSGVHSPPLFGNNFFPSLQKWPIRFLDFSLHFFCSFYCILWSTFFCSFFVIFVLFIVFSDLLCIYCSFFVFFFFHSVWIFVFFLWIFALSEPPALMVLKKDNWWASAHPSAQVDNSSVLPTLPSDLQSALPRFDSLTKGCEVEGVPVRYGTVTASVISRFLVPIKFYF